MNDPYRTPAPPTQEKIMIPKKIPTIVYILLCACFFGGGGMAAQYLTRDLPVGQTNVSSVFVVIAAMTMGIYFGIRGIISMVNEKKVD